MLKLIKIETYDKCVDGYTETYINPEKICFLTTIVDDGVTLHMAYLEDLALRLTPNSYSKLVRELYGEEV